MLDLEKYIYLHQRRDEVPVNSIYITIISQENTYYFHLAIGTGKMQSSPTEKEILIEILEQYLKINNYSGNHNTLNSTELLNI